MHECLNHIAQIGARIQTGSICNSDLCPWIAYCGGSSAKAISWASVQANGPWCFFLILNEIKSLGITTNATLTRPKRGRKNTQKQMHWENWKLLRLHVLLMDLP